MIEIAEELVVGFLYIIGDCTRVSNLKSRNEGSFLVSMDTKLVELLKCPNPWSRCTSVGVDNTSVNQIGIRDSIKTRVQNRNSAIFFNGCPAI